MWQFDINIRGSLIQILKIMGYFDTNAKIMRYFDTNAKIMGHFDTKTKFIWHFDIKIIDQLTETNRCGNLTHILKFMGYNRYIS